MPGNTIPAEGTKLGFGTISGTYTDIGEVISTGIPGGSVPVVDKTRLSSAFKEKRPGKIPDMGSITFRIQFDPNSIEHQTLRGYLLSPAIVFWCVTYNDGMDNPAKDEFQGFISEWEFSDAEDETNIEADITLEITGPVNPTPGSAGE